MPLNEMQRSALEWCRERLAVTVSDLEPLEKGMMRLGENNGSGWDDITDSWIATLKKQIADLEKLIAAYERLNA